MFSIYTENLLVTVATFILLSWGFYLPLRAGQIYNGAVFSAALGGYFAAYVTKELGWSVPAGFFGGVLFSGLFTFGLSFVLAPLTMFQMSVVTIALIFIFQTAFRNLNFLGGVTGMSGIPAMDYILIVCALAVGISLILLNRLYKSRWGRAMEAVEIDREMASTMGIDIIRLSIVLQTLSGILGGIGGVLYTFNLGTVHPEVFGFSQLLYCFSIVMVGGRNTPWGCLFFAPILWLIPEFFPRGIAEFRNIIFGIIIIIFLLTRPKGVITKDLVTTVERGFRFRKK